MKFPQITTNVVRGLILLTPLAIIDMGCSTGGPCVQAAQAYESCQLTQNEAIASCTKKFAIKVKKAGIGASKATLNQIWDSYIDCISDAPTCESQKAKLIDACDLDE